MNTDILYLSYKISIPYKDVKTEKKLSVIFGLIDIIF